MNEGLRRVWWCPTIPRTDADKACCCGDGLLPRPSRKKVNPYAEILLDALQASKVETDPHGRHMPRADMLINYILLVLLCCRRRCSGSIGHPPHSSASPVELRLRVGPRDATSGKKERSKGKRGVEICPSVTLQKGISLGQISRE